MAYLQHTNWRDRPGAVIGVIAVHAVIGYALVNGLKFTQIFTEPPRIDGYEVKVPIAPPPPPERKVEPDPQLTSHPVVTPLPPIDVSPLRPVIDTTPIIPVTIDLVPRVIPSPTPGPSARPSPAFDPVAPRPRGDPGSWVSEADYRSSWINREMVGTSRFRLQIAASGRVEGCTITGSSGHSELDKATCELVTRRAKFEPAKDDKGARVAGSYTNSVRWVLPE